MTEHATSSTSLHIPWKDNFRRHGEFEDETTLYSITPFLARQIMQEVDAMQHEIDEANAEIKRHHRDFRIVQDLIDAKDAHWNGLADAVRNVVG